MLPSLTAMTFQLCKVNKKSMFTKCIKIQNFCIWRDALCLMNLRLEYYNIYEIPDKEKIYNEPNILSSVVLHICMLWQRFKLGSQKKQKVSFLNSFDILLYILPIYVYMYMPKYYGLAICYIDLVSWVGQLRR